MPALAVNAHPAYLAEPLFHAQAKDFSFRSLAADFIFTVELRGSAKSAFGLQVEGPGLLLRTVTGADGTTTVSGAKPAATVRNAEIFQLERRGDRLIFSAAPFGQPLTVLATTGAPPGALKAGVYGAAAAAIRNGRWSAPSWPGLVPYKDYLGSRLELLDVASGAREVIFATDAGIEAPNYTPDGKAITFNSGGHIYRFDLASRQVTPIDTGTANRNNNDHVISPDGKWLGISSHTGKRADTYQGQSIVYKLPIGGGEPVPLTLAGPSYLHGWSPDGKHVLYTAERNGDFNIFRTTSDGAGVETQLTRAPGLDDGAEYAPDGKHIYFNSSRSGRMQLWRMDADGGAPRQLTDDAFNNWFPHASPSGRELVFLSYLGSVAPDQHPYYQHVYLRSMPAAGGTPRVLAYLYGGQGTINVPSWSPDGKRVALVSHTGPVNAALPLHRLENGTIHAAAAPGIGGRLVAFGLAGKPSFLKFDPAAGDPQAKVDAHTPNIPYLGHEVWLGPQSQWWVHQDVKPALAAQKSPWPPDPFLSVAPYRLVQASKDAVEMASEASPVSGVALTKRFALVPGKPNSLQVEVDAVNRRDSALAWDIWFNTRTHADARVYVPVAAGTQVRTQQIASMPSGPLKYIVEDGVFSLDMPLDPAPTEPPRHGKVFIQPGDGWMAGFHGGQAFIVQFPLQAQAAIHPEQGQIEIFNDYQPADPAQGLMEMEVHAPYRTLAPGESMKAGELWTILPYDGPVSRAAHLAFLRAHAAKLGLKGL